MPANEKARGEALCDGPLKTQPSSWKITIPKLQSTGSGKLRFDHLKSSKVSRATPRGPKGGIKKIQSNVN